MGNQLMPDAPGLELIAQEIERERDGTVIETAVEHGKATLIVRPDGVLHALSWLRDTPDQGYRFLSSLHAADYLPATPRFAVHYELLCRERVERINLKALLTDPAAGNGTTKVAKPTAPSPGTPEAKLRRCRLMRLVDRRSHRSTRAFRSTRPPSSRKGRPTTSSESSSAATPI